MRIGYKRNRQISWPVTLSSLSWPEVGQGYLVGEAIYVSARKFNREPIFAGSPAAETIRVPQGTSQVSCDGGGGALGHPVIWLTLTTRSTAGALAVCPYCSRQFASK